MASDTSSNQENAMVRRPKKAAPFKFLVPLIYAPALPLIRLSLRRNPVLRDRLFTAVLIGAFAHGAYLVYPSLFLIVLIFVFKCSSWIFCCLSFRNLFVMCA